MRMRSEHALWLSPVVKPSLTRPKVKKDVRSEHQLYQLCRSVGTVKQVR